MLPDPGVHFRGGKRMASGNVSRSNSDAISTRLSRATAVCVGIQRKGAVLAWRTSLEHETKTCSDQEKNAWYIVK